MSTAPGIIRFIEMVLVSTSWVEVGRCSPSSTVNDCHQENRDDGAAIMSDTVWAFVVAGVLTVAAGLVAVRTWQVRHSIVRWIRPPRSPVTHAIPKAELRGGPVEVGAVAHCGRWPAADLAQDDRAERCLACVRTVERLERHRN